MDLVRKILLAIEEKPTPEHHSISIKDYSHEMVVYHVMLLREAGLIEALDFSSSGGPDFRPGRLTWQGHEFLDAARDDTRWNEAKGVMTKVGGFALEVLKAVLIESMKSQALAYLKTP